MAGLALNLNSGDRTYGYAVSSVIMNGDASGFPFVDSGGNRIKCNYARVEVHYDYGLTDIRDHCVAWIEPSGPSSHTAHSITVDVNIANEVTTDDIAAGNVSGVYGQVTFADISNPGIVEFKCDNTEIMDCVNIRLEDHPKNSNHIGDVTIELVYGNVTTFNKLRQDRYDRGS
tara:strand:+ start:227 stop:745 length:519 start_codon:yes stop_codon:yes gene_type:complete